MNQHLNLFRFYNESPGKEFIENNLSRAFAICLSNDGLFFNHFLKAVITEEDYEYLFNIYSEDSKFLIDLQIDMSSMELENISKVYAIAMTTETALSMEGFLELPYHETKEKNITDIWITIKDISFVIEVKRTGEDCKVQLFNQVYPFTQIKKRPDIIPIAYPWPTVIGTMEKVVTLKKLLNQSSLFISDFLTLSHLRYSHWFPSKPFNVIPFNKQKGSKEYYQLEKRIRQALASSGYEVLPYSDRLGIKVDFGWATEIIPEFVSFEKDEIREYIVFNIWPGNTKGQGYQIYNKPLDWINKESLDVDGKAYELEINYHMKLSHFNRFISGLTFNNHDLQKPINTSENFYSNSGKWNEDTWKDFEGFMDEHFVPSFNWRKLCQWEEEFINSDRTYFTNSIGYEIYLWVPYSHFKAIDKRDEDLFKVGGKINSIVRAFKGLVD